MSDLDALAADVVITLQKVLTPVLERLAATEARVATLGDLRDRVVVIETKALQPVPVERPALDLAPLLERIAVTETKLADVATASTRAETSASVLQRDTSALTERIAVLETRPPLPGPVGESGQPGKDGVDGKDGAPGLSFEGVYQDGKRYDPGHLVTWAGSSWHCNEPTITKPGDGSKAWTLMVKRGRDGKDGVDAPGALPVVRTR